MQNEPWLPEESPDEEAERLEAYERLADAARRAGLTAERLRDALRRVAANELETRRFLRDEVYGVPDDLFDDLIRVRLIDLDDS